MRLIFAGTPAFAEHALRSLVRAGYEVVLVLTQPDRPAGRGLNIRPSEVKSAAIELGLPLAQPTTLKTRESLELLRSMQAEVMIVAAYGLILPQGILDVFPRGCINIHASLLPRWRGAAPIQRAILAGDQRTGISIMRMDAGLDTGPVLLTHDLTIASDDTAASLHDKLADLGARSVVECLNALQRGELAVTPQSPAGVTYASKIQKSEAIIDWNKPARILEREIRAFNPFPVASTTLKGDVVRLWRARAGPAADGSPGQVVDSSRDGIVVICGSGTLALLELQRASSKRLSAADFLRGCPMTPGMRFGS